MKPTEFTPAELETAAAALDAEEATARAERIRAKAAELRAERERKTAQAERAAITWASDQPSRPDDMLIVGYAIGELGPVRVRGGQLSHWAPSEQGEAVVQAARAGHLGRHGAALFGRELLICAQRLPDLRATLTAAFADDGVQGARPAYPGGFSSDAARIDAMFHQVLAETAHAPTLRGWAAAADDNDRALIESRLESLACTGLLGSAA